MCNCQPVIPLSEKGKSLQGCLRILFFVFLIFIIIQLVIQDFSNGFSSFITLIILVATFMMCHYLLAGILIFYTMFQILFSVFFIGLMIQNKIFGFRDRYSSSNGFYVTVMIVEVALIIFYVILIYYGFQAYKEFKALYFSREYGKIFIFRLYYLNNSKSSYE
jgi:hypothetical protein